MSRMRAAVLTVGTLGGLSGLVWGLLTRQTRHARVVIGRTAVAPFDPDGGYLPCGRGPVPWTECAQQPLRFAVLGDSSAAGLGADSVRSVPGARLATGLAEEIDRPVWLTTFAEVGATTLALSAQVDSLLADAVPDLCLMIIGANDVSTRLRVAASAALLGRQVDRLRGRGVAVVVGTCPDLGTVRPIPQPLRAVAHRLSLALAREQRAAVLSAGGHPVPLADLLSPEFLARPQEFFSADRFHPNTAGYDAAVSVLLPMLCQAVGVWGGHATSPPRQPFTPTRTRTTWQLVKRLHRAARHLLADKSYLLSW
jgi:lysophospholipase L1-like esterase